jgi:hypothetical protein
LKLTLLLFSRLIQEEKLTTEQRAEELESRVGSVEHMNLLLAAASSGSASSSSNHLHAGGRMSAAGGLAPQPPPRTGRPMPMASAAHLDSASPPLSGRSTPKSRNDPYMHKYHTVSGGPG